MVILTKGQIEKMREERYKERDRQYAILNGERPKGNPLCERGRLQKLTSLYESEGLYYPIFVEYEKLAKKYTSECKTTGGKCKWLSGRDYINNASERLTEQ